MNLYADRVASIEIIAQIQKDFNALKCVFASVFIHPLEQVLTGHQFAFADVEGGEVCPIQEDVCSGSGDVEVGLQVFCGEDVGKVIVHRILLMQLKCDEYVGSAVNSLFVSVDNGAILLGAGFASVHSC